MSDDEDDIVVLQVCANKQCLGIEDLQFDEEVGEVYCVNCRELYARAEKEGFYLLLTTDDSTLVKLVFECFDCGKGFWTWKDFECFMQRVERSHYDTVCDSEGLQRFFKEEYDISLSMNNEEEYVVSLRNLEDMYGGYFYNDANELYSDCDALEDCGLLNTGIVE